MLLKEVVPRNDSNVSWRVRRSQLTPENSILMHAKVDKIHELSLIKTVPWSVRDENQPISHLLKSSHRK